MLLLFITDKVVVGVKWLQLVVLKHIWNQRRYYRAYTASGLESAPAGVRSGQARSAWCHPVARCPARGAGGQVRSGQVSLVSPCCPMSGEWSRSQVRSGQVSLVSPCCPMSGAWSRRDTADIALDSRKSDRVRMKISDVEDHDSISSPIKGRCNL